MADKIDPDVAPGAPAQPGLKFLEWAVYIMGGLLVLMLVVLIGAIAWRAARRADAPPEAPKTIEVHTPEAVTDLALDGDRLAIRAGREIIVVDIRKGLILARIR